MKESFFLFLLMFHGAIHLLGFLKAFRPGTVPQLRGSISKPAGAGWLMAAVLFLVSGILLFVDAPWWWTAGTAAVLLSQALIIKSWADAKFGTIVNIVIVLPVLLSFLNDLPSSYRNRFESGVKQRLQGSHASDTLTEKDLQHLPSVVQQYLRMVGAVGRPKVHNVRVAFAGEMMQAKEGGWLGIESKQYNFFTEPARLFYIESGLYGVPFDGLHIYTGNAATMEIKVAAMLRVVDAKGKEMNQGETVTMFNDMCLLAPATLIDTAIQWKTIDSLTVSATFSNAGNTISAVLTFNGKGELVNFISRDRFLSSDGVTYLNYPWSTPVRDYVEFGGRRLPKHGEAIWHTPVGEFCYAKFEMRAVEYNCTTFHWMDPPER